MNPILSEKDQTYFTIKAITIKKIILLSTVIFLFDVCPCHTGEVSPPESQLDTDKGEKIGREEPTLSFFEKIYSALERENLLSKVEIGTEYSWIDYEEPDFMDEKGNMLGVYAVFTTRFRLDSHTAPRKDAADDMQNYNMIRLDGRFSWGSVDYDSENTGKMDDLDNYLYEYRFILGYDFPIHKTIRLTPYFGLGYRYLNNDLSGTSSTGSWGYERESKYLYIPLGVEANLAKTSDWSLILILEYDFFLDGTQKSHLEDGGETVYSEGEWYTLDTLVNDQDSGYGLKASLKIIKTSKYFDLYIEPFIHYWRIQESDRSQLTSNGGTILWYGDEELTIPVEGVEPKNNTMEYGLRVGFRF